VNIQMFMHIYARWRSTSGCGSIGRVNLSSNVVYFTWTERITLPKRVSASDH